MESRRASTQIFCLYYVSSTPGFPPRDVQNLRELIFSPEHRPCYLMLPVCIFPISFFAIYFSENSNITINRNALLTAHDDALDRNTGSFHYIITEPISQAHWFRYCACKDSFERITHAVFHIITNLQLLLCNGCGLYQGQMGNIVALPFF